MEKNNTLTITEHTKVLVPAKSFNFESDPRLLIPFTNGPKIGFVNNKGEIIVTPQYDMYYGDCYNQDDYIRVAKFQSITPQRINGKANAYQHLLYGVIGYYGNIIIPIEYQHVIPAINGERLFTVQNRKGQWGVIDENENTVIPFGKYDIIDGFDCGLARVKIGKEPNSKKDNSNKWGIINENGDEVLIPEIQQVWSFYGKPYSTIIVEKEGTRRKHPYSDFMTDNNNENDADEDYCNCDYDPYDDYYEESYGDFAGTYAQDYMGFSEDTIYDAFEGDADACWNID